jgi:hypothetical protein
LVTFVSDHVQKLLCLAHRISIAPDAVFLYNRTLSGTALIKLGKCLRAKERNQYGDQASKLWELECGIEEYCTARAGNFGHIARRNTSRIIVLDPDCPDRAPSANEPCGPAYANSIDSCGPTYNPSPTSHIASRIVELDPDNGVDSISGRISLLLLATTATTSQ